MPLTEIHRYKICAEIRHLLRLLLIDILADESRIQPSGLEHPLSVAVILPGSS